MSFSPALAAALADRYALLRELGAGGMATVYLARDVKHAREVAIKVLHPELAAMLGAERFLSEIRTTASLQHPHILPLFDSGEAAGQLFYVMPFVDGETLRTRLEREKQLPIADALLIAREVADALQYAHERGVIHRDIKPENILLQGGHALVADFGIALAVTNAGGTRMTQTGLSLGTPQYMAPEQAMGERTIDARADVYALGAVTYEMLAGEPPFTGPTSQAIVAKVMSTDPQRLDALRRSVPAHVADAVHHALEKLPADRWVSAAQFAAALRGEIAPPVGASSTASAPTGGPWRAAAIAAALVSVGLGAAWWRARESRAEPVGGQTWTTVIPAPDSLEIFEGGSNKLALDTAGTTLVAAIGTPGTANRRLYVRRNDDATWRLIPGTDSASAPQLSPDGRRVAFANSYRQRLLILPIEGGGRPEAFSGLTCCDFTWGYDGRLYFTDSGHVFSARPDGTARRRHVVRDAAARVIELQNPTPLPGGTHLLLTYQRGVNHLDSARLAVARLDGGSLEDLGVRGTAAVYADGHLVFGRDSALFAVPFDLGTRRVTGPPIRLASSVWSGGGGAVDFAVSRSGVLVYQQPPVADAERNRLVRVTARGEVTALTAVEADYREPRLSRDGRRVLVRRGGAVSDGDLYVVDLATGIHDRLTNDGGSTRGEWLADDTRFAYVRYGSADARAIRLGFADHRGPDSLLRPGRGISELSLAADGERVAVRLGNAAGGADIAVGRLTQLDSVRPLAVAATRAQERLPRLSPDGELVAYESNEGGGNEVYLAPAAGAGPRVAVTFGGGYEPMWSADGRTLYVRGERHLLRARVNRTPLGVLSRDTLFADPFVRSPFHQAYDVFPDGTLLMVQRGPTPLNTASGTIRVITNWPAFVRRAQASTGTP